MLHGKVKLGDVHIPYQWEYSNAVARTSAAGLTSADVGKLCRQLDDNTLWLLTSGAPTWVRVSGNTLGQAAMANEVLPPQATNAGKMLTTDGANAVWSAVPNGSPSVPAWSTTKKSLAAGETFVVPADTQLTVFNRFTINNGAALELAQGAELIIT